MCTLGTCKLPTLVEGVIKECNDNYDIMDEEQEDFGPGWNKSTVNETRYSMLLKWLTGGIKISKLYHYTFPNIPAPKLDSEISLTPQLPPLSMSVYKDSS